MALVVAVAQTLPLHARQRTMRVSGTVTNAITFAPIQGVSVLHRGLVVTTTDFAGRFETPALTIAGGQEEGSQVALLFQRIGYAPLAQLIDAPPRWSELNVQLAMDQLATELEEIVVQGERIVIRNPGLVGFYNRREEGFGRYLTAAEIDRAKSFNLTPYMRRLRASSVSGCTPLRPLVPYVDGIRFPSFGVVDSMLPPAIVGGVEVYLNGRVHQLPPEFIPAGPHCGVMLFWTREPKGPSPIEVGAHFGAQVAGDGSKIRLLGARIAFPLRQQGSLHLILGFDRNVEDRGERWHLSVIPALRPVASVSPLYIGTGVSLAKQESFFGTNEDIEFRHVVISGLKPRNARLSPFVELRFLNPLASTAGRAFLFSGVNLRIGPR